jgi:hypothetical protein
MKSNMNDDYEEEEWIRPPDEVKKERLMNDFPFDNDEEEEERMKIESDVDRAIRESLLMSKIYETNQIKFIQEEAFKKKMKRIEDCEHIHAIFKKIIKMDENANEIYSFISLFLENYVECGEHYQCKIDNSLYLKIFSFLPKIRLSINDIQFLKNIITTD